jgi:predicted CoA-substrate-specific enzyme activase
MRVAGFDIGSRNVKIMIREDGEIVNRQSISTIAFYRNYCRFDQGLKLNYSLLDLPACDIHISTGYGRNNLSISGLTQINEVKAHAYGVMSNIDKNTFIMCDVGGQDIKVARVERGIITDVELNDRCAASSGRFLEHMAAILETDVCELGKHAKEPVQMNSTCAVFSESELIGKIAEGHSFERLCAGVNFALYNRLRHMVTRMNGDTLVLSGGVVSNSALQKYLRNDCKEIILSRDHAFNGALGCCIYGEKYLNYEKKEKSSCASFGRT